MKINVFLLIIEGWLHSGDRGRYYENGEIIIIDRIKDIIICQMDNISPVAFEHFLQNYPGVEEIVIVPVPHFLDNERPMAFVKKVPGSKVKYIGFLNNTKFNALER